MFGTMAGCYRKSIDYYSVFIIENFNRRLILPKYKQKIFFTFNK